MYEFITIGGGEYFVEFFSGLASLIGSGDFLDTVRITGAVAFMWVMLNAAFSGSVESSAKWFVTTFLITQTLLYPKTTLHITDKTNPALNGATVDNVPYVIAVVADVSSKIGYSLTKQFEAVYSLPNDLKYQQNGMIFGVSLIETMTSATIYNSQFSESMDSFVRNCIFYDLMLNNYSFDDLKSSNDIWGFISPLQSENRFFTYLQSGSEATYPSCKDGINKLEADWNKEIGNWKDPNTDKINFSSIASSFGKTKKELKKTVLTALNSNGTIVNDYLLGVSMDSYAILKQSMMINAIKASAENYEAEHNVQLYQNARAALQAKSAYQTMGEQAAHWLPIIKMMFGAAYFALFPIIILLSLIPNMTLTVLKGYIFTFFWLAAWDPIYSVFNLFMVSGAASNMQDGMGGLNLINHDSLHAITTDVAAMAGYSAMFVSVIAAGLAKGGAAAMSSMTTSFLSVAQGASMQAANEGVTGNLSFGNVGIGGRQVSSGIAIQNDAGQLTRYNNDGSYSVDNSRVESNLGFSLNASERMESALSSSIAKEQSLANNQMLQSQQYAAKGFEKLIGSHRSIENSNSFSDHLTSSERNSLSNITNSVDEFAKNNNLSQSKAAEILANVGIGGKSTNLGLSAKALATTEQVYSQAQKFAQENHLSKDFSIVRDAIEEKRLNFSDSNSQTINENFNKSRSLSEEASVHLERAQRYSEQQQYIQSNSIDYNHNLSNEFVHYLSGKYGSDNAVLAITNPNQSDKSQLKGEISDFLSTKEQQIISGIEKPDFSPQYQKESSYIRSSFGPQNQMRNENPFGFNNDFRNIDNSSLEIHSGKTYSDTQQIINNANINNSLKGEVQYKQNEGITGSIKDEAIDIAGTLKGGAIDIAGTLKGGAMEIGENFGDMMNEIKRKGKD